MSYDPWPIRSRSISKKSKSEDLKFFSKVQNFLQIPFPDVGAAVDIENNLNWFGSFANIRSKACVNSVKTTVSRVISKPIKLQQVKI